MRYGSLNDTALSRAERLLPQRFPELPPLTLSPVESADIDQATTEEWQLNWFGFYQRTRNRPKAFRLKIQSDGQLCGMALGSINRTNNIVRINAVERSPVAQNATKGYIIDIALLTATVYGLLAGCKELRCMNPLDGAVRVYEDAGLTLVQDNGFRYCGKALP